MTEERKNMGIEELKREFLVDEDVLKVRLEPLVRKALQHGKIDKQGQVLITNESLSAKDRIMFALAARAIGTELEPAISASVSAAELVKYTGLPANQVRARCTELVESRLVESPERGVYRVVPHKIEAFLDGLSSSRERQVRLPRAKARAAQ
jgi:hypothetical protein